MAGARPVGMMQRFLARKPLGEPWRAITTAGATVTLNGGTVAELGGGVLRVTVPGGAATAEPSAGVSVRVPLYYADGTRVHWGDEFVPRVRIREAGVLPGLSSDTIVQAGVGTEGLWTFMHLAGMHYSAAARRMALAVRNGGAVLTLYATASTGNERGGMLTGEVVNGPVTWLRTGRAYGIDAAGARTSYSSDVASISWPGRAGTAALDAVISVRRSAATAGTETIDLLAEVFAPPLPR